MRKLKIKQISVCALFTAVIAATAFISVPTPFGVNLTLQIFGICLAAFCLGTRGAIISVIAYLITGASGLPVFSSFRGGISILFGTSGGFLWGFLFTAALCGMAGNVDNKAIKILIMVLSVLLCHTAGITQFCVLSGVDAWVGFVSVSLPFLVKDFNLVFLAEFTARKIKKQKLL